MIYGLLTEYIKDKELYPSAILESVKNNGMAECWCGSKGYGYKIELK